MRYDTTWRFTDEQRLLTYEAGDFVTGPLPWSSSVRVGGVQLSRDFAPRPGHLPVAGVRRRSGGADLARPVHQRLQVQHHRAAAGPVHPDQRAVHQRRREAVVVTTDALGRQVRPPCRSMSPAACCRRA
jgi:outer membrane usher protein